jgi:hypothetical protein
MASNNMNERAEPSEIDEMEIQKRLEEELANMPDYVPDENDKYETQSNYSIFNSSQANFNKIDGSQNIDDYIEILCKRN